jgi:hypothetical protein
MCKGADRFARVEHVEPARRAAIPAPGGYPFKSGEFFAARTHAERKNSNLKREEHVSSTRERSRAVDPPEVGAGLEAGLAHPGPRKHHRLSLQLRVQLLHWECLPRRASVSVCTRAAVTKICDDCRR